MCLGSINNVEISTLHLRKLGSLCVCVYARVACPSHIARFKSAALVEYKYLWSTLLCHMVLLAFSECRVFVLLDMNTS